MLCKCGYACCTVVVLLIAHGHVLPHGVWARPVTVSSAGQLASALQNCTYGTCEVDIVSSITVQAKLRVNTTGNVTIRGILQPQPRISCVSGGVLEAVRVHWFTIQGLHLEGCGGTLLTVVPSPEVLGNDNTTVVLLEDVRVTGDLGTDGLALLVNGSQAARTVHRRVSIQLVSCLFENVPRSSGAVVIQGGSLVVNNTVFRRVDASAGAVIWLQGIERLWNSSVDCNSDPETGRVLLSNVSVEACSMGFGVYKNVTQRESGICGDGQDKELGMGMQLWDVQFVRNRASLALVRARYGADILMRVTLKNNTAGYGVMLYNVGTNITDFHAQDNQLAGCALCVGHAMVTQDRPLFERNTVDATRVNESLGGKVEEFVYHDVPQRWVSTLNTLMFVAKADPDRNVWQNLTMRDNRVSQSLFVCTDTGYHVTGAIIERNIGSELWKARRVENMRFQLSLLQGNVASKAVMSLNYNLGNISSVTWRDNEGTALRVWASYGHNVEFDGNLTDCRFQNNTSTTGTPYPGVVNVYQEEERNYNIERCLFLDNTNLAGGGALNITSPGGRTTVRGCEFHGNHARSGGGALMASEGFVVVSDCKFEDNSSERQGGAMLLSGVQSAEVRNCSFADNRAESGGALAVLSVKSNSTFADLTFTNNTVYRPDVPQSVWSADVPRYVGGAVLLRADMAPLTLANIAATANMASLGGALFLEDQLTAGDPGGVRLDNVTFVDNVAVAGSGLFAASAARLQVLCAGATSVTVGPCPSWSSARGSLAATAPSRVAMVLTVPNSTVAHGGDVQANITLYDSYDQVAEWDNTSVLQATLQWSMQGGSPSSLELVPSQVGPVLNGRAQLLGRAASSGPYNVSGGATLSVTVVTQSASPRVGAEAALHVRACSPGEVESRSAAGCVACTPGWFSSSPTQPCARCPPGGACSTSSSVGVLLPSDGFWVAGVLANETYVCPYSQACVDATGERYNRMLQAVQAQLGLYAQSTSPTTFAFNSSELLAAQCSTGYTGNMCRQCTPYYGIQGAQCKPCPSITRTAAALVAALLLLGFVVSFITLTALRRYGTPAKRPVHMDNGSFAAATALARSTAAAAEVPAETHASTVQRHTPQLGTQQVSLAAMHTLANPRRSASVLSASSDASVAMSTQVQRSPSPPRGKAVRRIALHGSARRVCGVLRRWVHVLSCALRSWWQRRLEVRRVARQAYSSTTRTDSNLAVVFKILVTFLQLLHLLRRIQLSWPPFVVSNVAQFVDFSSLTAWLSVECLMPTQDYEQRVLWSTVLIATLPLTLTLLSVPMWLLAWWMVRTRPRPLLSRFLLLRTLLSASQVCYFLYPMVSFTIINVMAHYWIVQPSDNAWQVSSGSGVPLELWSASSSEAWGYQAGLHRVLVLAVFAPGLLLFVIGFPLATSATLTAWRPRLHQRDTLLALGFLYADYKERFYYWETLVLLRKAGVLLVAVYSPVLGPAKGAAVVQLLLMAALLAQERARPFFCPHANRAERVSLYGILATTTLLLLLTLMKPAVQIGSSSDSTAYTAAGVLLVVLVLLVLLYLLLQLLFEAAILAEEQVPLLRQSVAYVSESAWRAIKRAARSCRGSSGSSEHELAASSSTIPLTRLRPSSSVETDSCHSSGRNTQRTLGKL